MSEWIVVASAADVIEGEPLAVQVKGVPIALFRIGEGVFALHDLCSHGAARLSDGFVENGCVECPLHQGLIRIATGESASAPITLPVKTYPVRLMDGQVEVEL